MFLRKLFRLQNAAAGDTGGGTAVDRGDDLTPPAVTPPAEDPKVKELADQLAAEAAAEAEADAKAAEGDPEGEVEDADDSSATNKPPKGARIPVSRHQEMLNKERAKTAALAAEVAQLKQRGAVEADATATNTALKAMETEVETLEAQYAQLLVDNELAKAAAVMKTIRATERTMSDARADLKIQIATTQAAETSRYQTALTRIETAYPALNPDHDDFDVKAEARVMRMSQANRAAGMTPTAALQDAVETVLGAETASQEKATSVTPRPDAAAVAAARKAAATTKAAVAVAATPANLAKVGLDTDKTGGVLTADKAVKMSQKDFAAVTEAELSRMRGDTL
jgi:hypothetical protein